jgi:hypothetical protein
MIRSASPRHATSACSDSKALAPHYGQQVHNSTRSANAGRRKILYLREDHLLARIRHERSLHFQYPELRNAGPEAIA